MRFFFSIHPDRIVIYSLLSTLSPFLLEGWRTLRNGHSTFSLPLWLAGNILSLLYSYQILHCAVFKWVRSGLKHMFLHSSSLKWFKCHSISMLLLFPDSKRRATFRSLIVPSLPEWTYTLVNQSQKKTLHKPTRNRFHSATLSWAAWNELFF